MRSTARDDFAERGSSEAGRPVSLSAQRRLEDKDALVSTVMARYSQTIRPASSSVNTEEERGMETSLIRGLNRV